MTDVEKLALAARTLQSIKALAVHVSDGDIRFRLDNLADYCLREILAATLPPKVKEGA